MNLTRNTTKVLIIQWISNILFNRIVKFGTHKSAFFKQNSSTKLIDKVFMSLLNELTPIFGKVSVFAMNFAAKDNNFAYTSCSVHCIGFCYCVSSVNRKWYAEKCLCFELATTFLSNIVHMNIFVVALSKHEWIAILSVYANIGKFQKSIFCWITLLSCGC